MSLTLSGRYVAMWAPSLPMAACGAGTATESGAAREATEADLAGLWGQAEPNYRWVVLFTRDGKHTVRHSLKDESEQFRRLVEVRSGADATLKELELAQDKAFRLVDELDIRAEDSQPT